MTDTTLGKWEFYGAIHLLYDEGRCPKDGAPVVAFDADGALVCRQCYTTWRYDGTTLVMERFNG